MPVPPVRMHDLHARRRRTPRARRARRRPARRARSSDPITVWPAAGQQLANHRAAGVGLGRPRVRHREHEAADGRRRGGLVLVRVDVDAGSRRSTHRRTRGRESRPGAARAARVRWARSPAWICRMQPGLAVTTASAPGRLDVAHLAAQQAIGHLRLREVVDAGRAAAPVGLRQVDHAQPGDLGQQLARLPADLLAVHDVAGIVIRHRHRHRRAAARAAARARGTRPHPARCAAKRGGPLGPGRLARPAACRTPSCGRRSPRCSR